MTHWLKYGPLSLLLGMPLLTELSTCNANIDSDGDGYTSDVDCNDEDASIHPEAVEVCDGLDQDCDGTLDEDFQALYYPDADGDGYGDEALGASCLQTETSVSRGGDCDDSNVTIYPAAPDAAGDGVDASCDGVDGLAPSVGLPTSTFTSIQAALSAALDGQTVWVGPGTYQEHGLSMDGKSLRLASTAGQETTILDGMGQGTVFYFDSAETEASSVEGFTITGGKAACNSTIYFTNCYYAGGGMYLRDSSPTLKALTFMGNTTSWRGGGMYLSSSSPSLTQVTFTGNEASGDGGGMYLESSSPSLKQVTFTGNRVSWCGGGLYHSGSSPTLTQVTFIGNMADDAGGGMCLSSSAPTLNQVTFMGNTAESRGGGMALFDMSSPTLSNVTFTGNRADYGGGAYLWESSPQLTQATFAGNRADYGGGMYLYDSTPTLSNSILADNTSLNLYAYGSRVVFSYTNLHQASGTSHNLPSLPPTVTELEPGFVSFSPDGDASNDDLHLRPGSPLIDAGDPSVCTSTDTSGCDPDGSRPDLGAYGGPEADFSGYQDSDLDGLYDSWELAQAGNLTTLSGTQDADADELSDGDELKTSTSPLTPDSDGDGFPDGSEVAQGKDPLNPFSIPGIEGLVVLQVPSSAYPTLQAALDVIPVGGKGHVKLAAGTFTENLTLSQKSVTVEGAGEGQTILNGQQLDRVWSVSDAELNLSGVRLESGMAPSGGGMQFNASTGQLSQVTFTGNMAEGSGGGMYLSLSSPTLTNVTFAGNTADAGGAMYLGSSAPSLKQVTFTRNTAKWGSYDSGGGMYLQNSFPTMTQVTFTENDAKFGGGMYLSSSSPTLSNVTFTQNAADAGGGMYLNNSASPTLTNVTFAENTASGSFSSGGGIYGGNPILTNVLFTGNIARGQYSYGGGISNSYPTLKQVTFTGNEAQYGGGMYLYGSLSVPTLTQVTFTENAAQGGTYGYGGGLYLYHTSPILTQVTFIRNSASGGTYGYGGGMYVWEASPALTQVTFVGNISQHQGGGMYLRGLCTPTLVNSILAYNRALSGGNFYGSASSSVKATTSLFYNISGWGTDNLIPTGNNLTVEPKFLDYADSSSGASCTPGFSTTCVPADLHPALDSPLIDAGDPAMPDVDGSRADLGAYGGPGGGSWDVDADGAPDYFWPGEWDDAPSGSKPADYDCDDLDPDVQGC